MQCNCTSSLSYLLYFFKPLFILMKLVMLWNSLKTGACYSWINKQKPAILEYYKEIEGPEVWLCPIQKERESKRRKRKSYLAKRDHGGEKNLALSQKVKVFVMGQNCAQRQRQSVRRERKKRDRKLKRASTSTLSWSQKWEENRQGSKLTWANGTELWPEQAKLWAGKRQRYKDTHGRLMF